MASSLAASINRRSKVTIVSQFAAAPRYNASAKSMPFFTRVPRPAGPDSQLRRPPVTDAALEGPPDAGVQFEVTPHQFLEHTEHANARISFQHRLDFFFDRISRPAGPAAAAPAPAPVGPFSVREASDPG